MTSATTTSFYEITDKDMDGNVIPMSKYEGNVVLIVNVASYWGYTKDYADLSKLYDKHNGGGSKEGSLGLRILAFPCNQFANEEPGTHTDIISFVAQQNFGKDIASKIDFFEKGNVNGPNQRDLYTFLKQQHTTGGNDISWNFEKFLIDFNVIYIKDIHQIYHPVLVVQ